MSTSETATRRPPGPDTAVPLDLNPETLSALQSLQRDYGDIVSIEKPNGRLAYFVNDPAEVRRILVRRHARYVKGPGFERVKMLLGNGLIVSDGDVWRRSRTMIQPSFKVQNVHRLMHVMVQCTDRRAAAWANAAKSGGTINITAETNEFALELILISIFGDDYENKLLAGGGNPFEFLSKDSTRDLSVVMKIRQLRKTLLELINERRQQDDETLDFLSMYMSARDKEGSPFSDEELLDELMTLIVAGFETSANTLNWVWYLIAGHPDVERSLLAEAAQYLPTVSAVTPDNLSNMKYIQQVLEEVLRLYPPVWLFTRRSRDSDELENYDVPPGTDIYLSPYLLHRSEQYWPQPNEFNPDRFAPAKLAKKDRPYFPFSLGPRRCLGEYFSFIEMKVHVGLLLPRFKMQRVTEQEPDLELAINLRCKDDIFLRPTIR